MSESNIERRQFIKALGLITPALASPYLANAVSANFSSEDDVHPRLKLHQWDRDARNPVFPPGKEWFDSDRAMNPFIVKHEEKYLLYYSGKASNGEQRICLASCSENNIYDWKRLGPVVDIGKKGSFDDLWCVLPCVHKINGKWHMYYTGRKHLPGAGLQSFTGIGLAVSDDLYHWKKVSPNPVLEGDGFNEWPDNKGIAGGGSIIEIPQKDGKILYRMYYTLCPGTPSKSLFIDQKKLSVIAHSYDGITWADRRIVMRPRLDAKYENVATIALNVWRTKKQWRAIYAGIGTQFGAYSICEAVSEDGLNWYRGRPGDNLSLPPGKAKWEDKMTTYPNVIMEDNHLRLFYCGNGYGRTGIGTATAKLIL